MKCVLCNSKGKIEMPVTRLDENEMLKLSANMLCYHCMYDISKAYNNILQIGWDKLDQLHNEKMALDTVKDGWQL